VILGRKLPIFARCLRRWRVRRPVQTEEISLAKIAKIAKIAKEEKKSRQF
jgi:hypothetical protein